MLGVEACAVYQVDEEGGQVLSLVCGQFLESRKLLHPLADVDVGQIPDGLKRLDNFCLAFILESVAEMLFQPGVQALASMGTSTAYHTHQDADDNVHDAYFLQTIPGAGLALPLSFSRLEHVRPPLSSIAAHLLLVFLDWEREYYPGRQEDHASARKSSGGPC